MTSIRLRAVGALCLVVCLGLPAGAQAKPNKKVCADAPAGYASCASRVVTDAGGQPAATATPAGFGPSDIRSAYNLNGSNSTQTVAIVDAYDDPNAESDLATYRSHYGLSPCTTANGCFRKVNQSGGTRYPRANSGWAEEISLDIDMVSATCPGCHILLVEASSSSLANLGDAVNYAASQGVAAISNSYGGSEFSSESAYAGPYNHPGIAITVSSGDNGYGVEFPAAANTVTAVGGTSLRRDSSARGFSETAWSGAGSGCSAYISKPTWQKDTGCARRTVADVSAVADPNTGVAVYDTYRDGGWLVFGGTSVSSPIVGSVYAMGTPVGSPSQPYSTSAGLFDVTSGSNGSCSPGYLCTAGPGYDGPTGLGTPNGTSAF